MSASMVTLTLSFLVLDVLVDLLGGRLVDTLDDMAEHAHGAADAACGASHETAFEVDAALDELGAQHVDNLLETKSAGALIVKSLSPFESSIVAPESLRS